MCDQPVPHHQALLAALRDRTARVAVVGLGYVGLPLASALARAGFEVRGLDVDAERCAAIALGRSPIGDVADEALAALVAHGRLSAGTDPAAALEGADVVIICVPTPLRKTKDPDISHVAAALEALAPFVRAGMLVVLESTTYPGTTEELMVPALAAHGALEPGVDLFLAFSPERIDPGNKTYTLKNTPKVVGGLTARCSEAAGALYASVVDTVVPVASARTAEMVKLFENTFRAVNIGLANELAIMCDRIGVCVWEVVDAAATKPFGFMRFDPGPGLGGHCLPVDPHYLSWKLRGLNYRARFIELASEVNTDMPDFVFDKLMRALNRQRKCLNGARVLILGVAYKPDVADVRESPALVLIGLLTEHGAEVSYHDPHVPSLAREGIALASVSSDPTPDAAGYDLVVIVTDHSGCDYARVAREAALVFDCRNAIPAASADAANVVRL